MSSTSNHRGIAEFDEDLELRVQAVLAARETTAGYAEAVVERIGRMWYALASRGIAGAVRGRFREAIPSSELVGGLHALTPNRETAIGPDGSFYVLRTVEDRSIEARIRQFRERLKTSMWIAVPCVAVLAFGLGANGLSIHYAVWPTFTGMLAYASVNRGTSERMFVCVPPSEVSAHHVELAYNGIQAMLRECEATRRRSAAVTDFAMREHTDLLALGQS